MFRLAFLQIDCKKTRHIEHKLTSSITHAGSNHTNGIYCKRRTVVEGVKSIDSDVENGQECGATSIKSTNKG